MAGNPMQKKHSSTAAPYIEIAGRKIGKDYPPYIVAELSANHNGNIDVALESIEVAKKMGADAIKIQTYTADTMTLDCDKEDFKIKGGLWDGYTLYDLYREAQTPFEWHKPLFDKAKEVGITLFSSPFDESAVDLLESLNAPAYKIASFELVDIPLIQYIAKTGKPIVMSTGMANKEEIGEAINAAREAGCNDLIVLHCVSAYPAPVEESNLLTIKELEREFDIISGLSDHSEGLAAPIASIALGGCFVEKHFILDRNIGGPDSSFSIEPEALALLCREAKHTWQALGKGNFDQKKSEKPNVQFRRSIYVVEDIKKGDVFTSKNIRRIRPGFGLEPKYYEYVLGRFAKADLLKGTPMSLHYLDYDESG